MQHNNNNDLQPILAPKTKSLTTDQVLITTTTCKQVFGEDPQRVLERIVTIPKRKFDK